MIADYHAAREAAATTAADETALPAAPVGRAEGKHEQAAPPLRLPATDRDQVCRALAMMGYPPEVISQVRSIRIGETDYAHGTPPEIFLGADGLKQLGAYYERKYGTSIVFAGLTPLETWRLGPLIDAARQAAGGTGDVRRAFYFGETTGHGCAAIYTRDGGKEALFWFDSLERDKETWNPTPEMLLAGECTTRKLPMYALSAPLQKDGYSCYSQALKACVTFTRRRRDAGGPGPLIVPNLAQELESRKVSTDGGTDIRRVRAMPEIAKLAQSRTLLAEHAQGADRSAHLRGSKREHTLAPYEAGLAGPYEARYVARKVLQHTENMRLEKWNSEIGRRIPGWTDSKKLEFVRTMKEMAVKEADVLR